MRILIDTKNLALYGGGIAHWFSPLLAGWLAYRQDMEFLLLGPIFDTDFLPRTDNWKHVLLPWPKWLPRFLRHPWYDNIMFPYAVFRLQPDLVISPYHDVRMPKRIPCAICVHDLCLDELAMVYPWRIRAYYLSLLRTNLRRAALVITVSETSRGKLIKRYDLVPDRVVVVYNNASNIFQKTVGASTVADFRQRHCTGSHFLFYPGGSEYRKNLSGLVRSFALLSQDDDRLILLVTGVQDSHWRVALAEVPASVQTRVIFTGRLCEADLHVAYTAADAVVYPSLCEGFGRICLEAMETGTPLVCSDLAVMHEVAGDYAYYFDPHDIVSICNGIRKSLSQERCVPIRDGRFQFAAVETAFLDAMDRLIETVYDQEKEDETGR